MNNWKEKLIVAIAIVLVFLFVTETTAQASAVDYTPSYVIDNLSNYQVGEMTKALSLWVGANGMYLEVDESTHTWGVDSSIVTFDVSLGRGNFNNVDVNYTSYDYFELFMEGFEMDVTLYNDYDSEIIQSMTSSILNVKPYVEIDGETHYISNGNDNAFTVDHLSSDIPFLVGAEISLLVNYNGYEVSDTTMASYYGSVDIGITRNAYNFGINGIRYASTGEEAIVDSIISWGNIQNTTLNSIYTKVFDSYNKLIEIKNVLTVNLMSKLTDMLTTITENDDSNFASTLSKMQSFMDLAKNNHDALYELLELNHSDVVMCMGDIWAEIMWGFEDMRDWMSEHSTWLSDKYDEFTADFQLKHETIVSKLDEIIETLTRGYKNPVSDSVDKKMDSDLLNLDVAQKDVTGFATENLENFTVPSDGFDSFDPRFMGAFALVSGMMQTIFDTSGNFTITMSVIFIMTIASMVTGLFRYFKE